MQAHPRPTLQVIELARIPYTRVQYRFSNQDHVLYIYDSEGKEKFHADRYPARWDRIERLFKAISTDLMPLEAGGEQPEQLEGNGLSAQKPSGSPRGNVYRVPVEIPPYTIDEENDEDGSPGRL
jgi:hypothetical protein